MHGSRISECCDERKTERQSSFACAFACFGGLSQSQKDDRAMTHDTDALVSELRAWAKSIGVPNALASDINRAADAIARLTRELGEEKETHEHATDCFVEMKTRAETAEAALSAARAERDEAREERDSASLAWSQALNERDAASAELAECRKKTLDEAIGACCPHVDDDAMDRQAKHQCATKIAALKEAPHE